MWGPCCPGCGGRGCCWVIVDTAGGATADEGTVSVVTGFEESTEVPTDGGAAKGTEDEEGAAELVGEVTAAGGDADEVVVVVVVVVA